MPGTLCAYGGPGLATTCFNGVLTSDQNLGGRQIQFNVTHATPLFTFGFRMEYEFIIDKSRFLAVLCVDERLSKPQFSLCIQIFIASIFCSTLGTTRSP
jgi:hypothetical protein